MNKTEFKQDLNQWMKKQFHSSMPAIRQHSKIGRYSMSQFGAMGYVIRTNSATVSDIAQELGISNAATSQIIDQLVNDGLFKRTQDPDDRRVKKIEITAKGTKFMEEFLQKRMELVFNFIDSFSDDEVEIVSSAYLVLKTKLEMLHKENI